MEARPGQIGPLHNQTNDRFDSVGDLEQPPQITGADHGLAGNSKPMKELIALIAKVARINSIVLIRGESGTGKELVAHALHRCSRRSSGPFVAINCAAFPESLLESELFGHEKGAFTGADKRQKGKFELAAGGTLFLDEVGELSPGVQAKLLRALQEREVDMLGGTNPLRIDIRPIAATNCDLEAAVATGRFRRDLYYRLRVVTITTPPLRERREDIPALAHLFALKYGVNSARPVRGVSPEAVSILQKLDWPGNVRELENAIQSAVAVGETGAVLPEDLPSDLRAPQRPLETSPVSYYEAIYKTQCQLLENAFARALRDYKEAARLLGLHPKSMHKLIKKLGLDHLLDHLSGRQADAPITTKVMR